MAVTGSIPHDVCTLQGLESSLEESTGVGGYPRPAIDWAVISHHGYNGRPAEQARSAKSLRTYGSTKGTDDVASTMQFGLFRLLRAFAT